MTEIEKVKAEIKVLEAKLSLLEEIEKHKSPVEKAYKDWWGQYPELETDSQYDVTRWHGFQAGFRAAYEEKVREDDYYNEVECDEKDNPKPMDDVIDRLENKYKKAEENAASYMTDEVIDRVVKKYQAQKLFDVIRNLGYSVDMCYEIVDAMRCWLPKPQSAVGSQNIDVELLVDGFNDCLKKIKDGLG